ncbi:hypothetical protein DFH06DRAFT_1216425 [Mycena polygramma]|nr:hypothetical protein DFH06DRAFT_1216425 [Mycena polygramma]
MLSAKFVLTALALASMSMAAPLATPTVTLCTASLGVGCVGVPVGTNECVNFEEGLTFLNKEVSAAEIPDGFVCTFFEDFGCTSAGGFGGPDVVVLTGGDWNMFSVPGITGTEDFNDLTSSISCSPL